MQRINEHEWPMLRIAGYGRKGSHYSGASLILESDGKISANFGAGRNEDGHAVPSHDRKYAPGEVCAAEEPDIHRISNDEDVNLINLHVYTPPLSGFGIYAPAE